MKRRATMIATLGMTLGLAAFLVPFRSAQAFWGCNVDKSNLGRDNNCQSDCGACEAEQNGTDDCSCATDIHDGAYGGPNGSYITYSCHTAGQACENNW